MRDRTGKWVGLGVGMVEKSSDASVEGARGGPFSWSDLIWIRPLAGASVLKFAEHRTFFP